MSLGELLRKLREDRGWAQEDLAVELESLGAGDVDRSTISRWETGKRLPSPEMLALLVRALGLDAEQERLLRLAAAREKGYLLPGREAPFQVPRDVPHFVGRQEEIAQLESALGAGQIAAICGIAGMGGIGKSALAAHFAFTHSSLFPDGVLYASLRDSDPQNALLAFAAAYGVSVPPAADLATRAALVRSALTGKRILVILDNAEDADAARQVLSGCGHGSAVLVTTRDQELAAAVVSDPVLCLPVLTVEESLALLDQLLGSSVADEAAAREVVALLGHLPLAVEIAGRLARLRGWEPAELLARLRDEQARLEVLQVKDLQVRTSFNASYEMLGNGEQALFAALAVFQGLSFEGDAAEMVVQLPDAQEKLRGLCNLSLVWTEGSRYRQHPLLADFALEKLRATSQEGTLRERHARYYLELAEECAGQLAQPATLVKARERFDAAVGQIRAARSWAAAERQDEIAARYALALGPYFELVGPYQEAAAWAEAGLQAARRVRRRDWEGRLLGYLGNASAYLGEMEQALRYFELAGEIAREIGDRRGQGIWLRKQATAYCLLGETRKAIAYHEQALQIARDIGNRREEAASLGNLGLAWEDYDVERSVEYYEQALAITREIGDQEDEALWLGNLGSAYYALGRIRQSIQYTEQALALARAVGARWGEAAWLSNLGSAYLSLGEAEKSIQCHQESLEIVEAMGDPWGAGHALTGLGDAHYRQGNIEAARKFWQQACAVLKPLIDQADPASVRAGAVLGLAITDPGWSDPQTRESLLTSVLSACQDALAMSTNPGMLRMFLRDYVRPFQSSGIEGLGPVAELIEKAMADSTRVMGDPEAGK